MNHPMTETSNLAAAPLSRPWVRAIAVMVAAGLMAVAAQVAVPVPGTPVPMTLQSFAVIVLGGVLGARMGATAMTAYLMLGLIGLPVFAAGGSGLTRLLGPTGGYLLAFPVAAAATGAIVGSRGILRAWLGGFVGMALIHLGGISQLAILTGSLEGATRLGSVPFLTAAFAKIGIASLALPWLRRKLPLGS